MTDHLALWDSVQATDPNFTKSFTRGGGFKGTSTNATWLAKQATAKFGPCGIGWGLTVLDEHVRQGHPILIDPNGTPTCYVQTHVVRVQLWYVLDGKRGEIEQFGQTTMVGKNSSGLFTDEEAPKKSITDAMTKCLSMLGFAADVHLGLYDDNKYVAELHKQFAPEPAQEQHQEQRAPARDLGPRLTVQDHLKTIKQAVDTTALKHAFALAWKQYEDPADPGKKTESQMKFKDAYDKRALQLSEVTRDPEPQAEGGMPESPLETA